MSTRTQIAVKGSEIKIYKHSDGYPTGVLPVLVPFMHDFLKRRGNDPEYMLARCLMAFARDEEEDRKKQVEKYQSKDSDLPSLVEYYKQPSVLGFGLDLEWHVDLAWFYILDGEKATIEIWRPDRSFWDNPGLEHAHLFKVLNIHEICTQDIDKLSQDLEAAVSS